MRNKFVGTEETLDKKTFIARITKVIDCEYFYTLKNIIRSNKYLSCFRTIGKLFGLETVTCLVLKGEVHLAPISDLIKIGKVLPSQEMRHRTKKMKIEYRSIRTGYFQRSSGRVWCLATGVRNFC